MGEGNPQPHSETWSYTDEHIEYAKAEQATELETMKELIAAYEECKEEIGRLEEALADVALSGDYDKLEAAQKELTEEKERLVRLQTIIGTTARKLREAQELEKMAAQERRRLDEILRNLDTTVVN